NAYAAKHRISYAVFCLKKKAAYLGHLPFRLIKDLDVIVTSDRLPAIERYFHKSGFMEEPTAMSSGAQFRRYTKRTPSVEIMVHLFPDKFTFLDLQNPKIEPMW